MGDFITVNHRSDQDGSISIVKTYTGFYYRDTELRYSQNQ